MRKIQLIKFYLENKSQTGLDDRNLLVNYIYVSYFIPPDYIKHMETSALVAGFGFVYFYFQLTYTNLKCTHMKTV